MELSVILNLILGGGLVTTLIALFTMRATMRKANAEAKKANAEADTVQISNTEQATRILVENIVEPLKNELTATRNELSETKKEMSSTKREIARLRKAVNDANGCKHRDDCPVLHGLREFQKANREIGEFKLNDPSGQYRDPCKMDGTSKSSNLFGKDGNTGERPP